MATLAVRISLSAVAKKVSDHKELVTIALFCGIGLLVSISTIVVEQYKHASLTTYGSTASESLMVSEVLAKIDVSKLPDLQFEDMSVVFSTPTKH